METTPAASTRGIVTDSYALITPENLVDNRLPYFEDTIARPLATPRFPGACLGQYLLDFGTRGRSLQPLGGDFENFVYQVRGEAVVEAAGDAHPMAPGAFCYFPLGAEFALSASGAEPSQTLWTKRRYDPVRGVPMPNPVAGHQSDVPSIKPEAPASYTYQELLPTADPSYDMAMNVLTADPGGSIGIIEMHHQEHGLLMLDGQGVYYLAGRYHQVFKGDYIYMAPYCPQSFWATGSSPASYLLYKDINRDGFFAAPDSAAGA